MAYIEENLKIHSGPPDPLESKSRDTSAEDESTLSERWKIKKRALISVWIACFSRSCVYPEASAPLIALESIEEMEKAKRQGPLPVYRPRIKHKSDVEIM
ncbi:hypothetical protein EDC04DRAFT_2902352 [Pisolithus marmoratus]|nr:hypothetical protein EDC04DRAFT_2902352 [Pisolithus marmoratus]